MCKIFKTNVEAKSLKTKNYFIMESLIFVIFNLFHKKEKI